MSKPTPDENTNDKTAAKDLLEWLGVSSAPNFAKAHTLGGVFGLLLTDRISNADEQLGAEKTVKLGGVEETKPNIEVRIGAILSLERIAQDSTAYDKGRDHLRCMEILCAYVRENAPALNLEATPIPFKNQDSAHRHSNRCECNQTPIRRTTSA